MDENLVNEISHLIKTRNEYDILPHLVAAEHSYLQHSEYAFAVCSCVGTILWNDLYMRVLNNITSSNDTLHFLLLFVPSCVVLWNRIKQLIISESTNFTEELSFTGLILRRHPRSAETLQHRQWISQYASTCDFNKEFDEDISFLELLADKHRCNYAVWDYRRWLLKKNNEKISESLLFDELEKLHLWLIDHPNDNSGWSYRGHILDSWKDIVGIQQPSNELLTCLQKESIIVRAVLDDCPVNESVWKYRQILDSIFIEISGNLTVTSLSNFDPFVSHELLSNQLSDCTTIDPDHSTLPSPFNRPWSAVLYKRHLCWLSRLPLFRPRS